MKRSLPNKLFHGLVTGLALSMFCSAGFLSAQAASLPVPAGEYDVHIKYFSLKRRAAAPKGKLVPLRPSGSEDCKAGAAAQYYKQLPVIEVSPGADTLAGKHARYFPGVLSEFVLRDWHLPEQALPSIRGLEIPRAYDLPGRAELRGTILLLPGLGSQPQYYLTMATGLASRGYRVLISAHPGISGDAYTAGNCVLPGIDQSRLMALIQKPELIDPVMEASVEVLMKDLEVLADYAGSTDTAKPALPLFVMGHSIGGIAANMYCTQKGTGCAAAVNLDGGEYPRFPLQSWPSDRDLPYLKFHSTENIDRDRIPKELIGPRQCVFDFDGHAGKVLHGSFTDIGFFKGIPAEEMPLADLRGKTEQVILSFLEQAGHADGPAAASVSWCGKFRE